MQSTVSARVLDLLGVWVKGCPGFAITSFELSYVLFSCCSLCTIPEITSSQDKQKSRKNLFSLYKSSNHLSELYNLVPVGQYMTRKWGLKRAQCSQSPFCPPIAFLSIVYIKVCKRFPLVFWPTLFFRFIAYTVCMCSGPFFLILCCACSVLHFFSNRTSP